MKRKTCLIVAAALASGLAFAPPALAHQGHRSCGAGAHVFVVPLAQSGEAGEFASTQAKAGSLAAGVAAAHAALCEPAP